MARVAVTSCMYLGDVAPYIPIARALHERGHDVVFVAPEGFRPLVASEPFAFHPYGLDASPAAMNADPVHTKLMRHPMLNSVRLGRYWMRIALTANPDAAVASLKDAFAGADVVVTHPTMGTVAIPVARAMGARTVVGQLFPMMMETREWTPPLGSRSRRLPTFINRASWFAGAWFSSFAFRDDVVNSVRAGVGLPRLRAASLRAWTEADATVVLVSRHFFGDGPADWPPVTWGGFSNWRPSTSLELDDDLAHSLDDGDPPVLVMLGTSAATNAGQQFARIARDLDAAGMRSVLLVGHASNLAAVSAHPAARTFAPIDALLPRCRAAVVSGALGGVAAALSTGVPVVVHPQLFDQVWHGAQIERLGVGVMARRTARVGAAVRRVCDDPAYADRAQALAGRMADEDGAAATADVVESLLR